MASGPIPGNRRDSRPTYRNTNSTGKPRQLSNRAEPNANRVNGEPTSAAVKQRPSAPSAEPTKLHPAQLNSTKADSVKAKVEAAPVPILILGAQGCGKSSLINAAFGNPVREVSNGFELGTQEFHFNSLTAGGNNFMLVDSPGFDNSSMNDAEVMTKLIRFLCCGKAPAQMSGVIYVHTQDTRLGSGTLRRNLYIIKSILGDSFVDRLTILLVPRPGEKVNHQELVRPLLDPKSPFYALYESGAQFNVSSLETQPIRNILLSYSGRAPALMSVQNELCSRRAPNDADINNYLMRCARTRESGSGAKPRIVPTAISQIQASSSNQNGSSELKKLQLELAASKKESEEFSTQLQQQLDHYTALRSQLQINENLEQRDIVQHIIDLNRRIEDLALSLSQHLVDTYGGNIATTRDAFNLPELKQLFGHEDRKASLVMSSTGMGRPLEDFLDVAIRSLLCEQVYRRIIAPFHPGLESLDARNRHILAMYGRIREKESQATLGRWRTASFTAISGLIGEQELSNLKSRAGSNILNDGLMPMLQYVFGPEKNAQPKEAHVKELSELSIQAWDWCVTLKEKIVLLGDFQPTAYRYGAGFDPALMTEFEPRPGSQPPNRILSTIGLGLNVFRAQSSGEGSDRVMLRPASVVTEGWFERS